MAENALTSQVPHKTESVLLIFFVPSSDRFGHPISQEAWVASLLEFLGIHFGGATALPKGRGVWRDDARGGTLVFDETVAVHCYTNAEAIEKHRAAILAHLLGWGQATKQGAVGFVLDHVYMEFLLPLQFGGSP
jgi:hypothetical protein